METINQKAIDALNNLLEINNDRIEGYKRAMKETDEADLKQLFAQFVQTSYGCKLELTAEVQKLGGTPIEGTRTTGKLYRAWMDIKSALTKRDRKAILKSCEFGEDVAVNNYDDALRDQTIESEFYPIITKQYAAIRSEHDTVKNLRDAPVSVNA